MNDMNHFCSLRKLDNGDFYYCFYFSPTHLVKIVSTVQKKLVKKRYWSLNHFFFLLIMFPSMFCTGKRLKGILHPELSFTFIHHCVGNKTH